MKNFCTSVIFIIIGSAALYAQEVEPLLQFNINGQTQPFPVDTLRFRHKIPIIANWGVGRSIGDALNFKINHGSNISNPNNFTDSSGIVKAGDVTILGQGMEYEPTLIMTTQQCSPSGFVARPYDTQNQCFGFRNIDTTTGIISYDHTSYDYNRYQLRHDSLVAHTGGVRKKVLSGVWMNNQIGDEISNANGRTWYLTLNLRRLTSINYGSANDTVLSLRIKYWKLPLLNNIDSGYIRFDSAFQSSSSTASTSRGLMDNALNPTNRNGTDTIFVIRRSYLPAYQNNGGSITLSSHFTTNGINSLPWDNPLFAPFNRGYVNSLMRGRDIDSIDVEVYYHGAADIGLDWIRIENTQLRSIVRGAYDNSVKNNVQTSLNTIAAMGRGITYHRVYLADEQPILRWRGLGYWNRVLNNGGQMEVVMEYPSHFAHSIGFKELWNNLGVPMANNTAAPYVRNGHGGIIDTSMAFSSMLGLKSGWHNGNTSSDGSSYEMIKFKSNSRSLGVQGFFDDLFSAFSLQFVPYLTSGKSSWGQVWVYSNWNKRRFYNSNINARDSSASTTYWRPQTGEEIRLEAWPQLILGVKGLAFYILGNAGYGENHWFLGGASGTYQGSIIGRTLIDSPLLGTDYLLWGNDSASNGDTYLHAHLNSSVINWNALGINQNRIYIGRRSQRMEILKLTDYLKATEKELSNLYLRAYYTKSLNSKLLGKTQDFTRFISIDTNYLKIRPVGRVDTNNQPYHEAFSDSVCVDITLLHSKDTINYPSSSTVYIGVCNRKSSPLFRSPINNNDWTFYPTRMFDSLTLGENMTQSDRNMWANYRYKQSGSREVNIPFKFTSPDNSYALLQITELGADDPYLDSVYNYRNNPALYQKVDTVICQDGTLSLKLLPGEGKIFRVRVLPTDPSVTGNLGHSNQRKLISFPVPVYDSVKGYYVPSADSVRYHLCYFRPVSTSDKRTVVCYRRSKSTARNSPYANLVWENEVILSNSYSHPTRTIQNDTCAYPSLVARYDTVSGQTYCYVVYGCKGYMPQPPLMGIQEPFQRIVESKIWHINATPWHYAYILADSVYTNNLAEFGTPMIAASEQNALGGNFYAWADRKRGIGVGWHRSQYNSLESKRYIRFHSDTSECFSLWKAQHPSLSTYIPLRHKGHDCALVWQENYSCDDIRSEIFTTRLRANGLTVEPYLGPEFMTVGNFAYFNADSSIYCMSNAIGIMKDTIHLGNTMAMPWREQSLRHTCTIEPLSQAARIRLDAIVWEKRLPSIVFPVFGYGLLVLDGLAHYDTLIGTTLQPLRTQALSKTLISHFPYGWMYRPSLSQGHATMSDESFTPNALGCVNSNAKSLIINAVETNEAALPGGGTTWLPVYFHRELSHSIFAQLQTKQYVSSTSSNPYIHLAGIPFALTPTQRWEHRRVYSYHPTSSTALPQILGSAQYFYKLSDRFISRVYHGWKDADGYVAISAPHINGHELEWNIQDRTMSIAHDTLITSWFRINDETLLQQKIKTDGWDALQVSIQKQGEQPQRLPLSLQRDPLGLGVMHTIEFSQGDNNFYRLLYTRGTVSEFQREICTEMEDNGLSKKTSTTINLSQLGHNNRTFAVYPNPANDELSVVWSGGKATVEILDSQGLTVFSAPMTTSVTLSTKELSSGVYMVRLKQGLYVQSMSVIVLH